MNTTEDTLIEPTKHKRPGAGFASLSRERNRELAAMGGKAAHAAGVAHKWTSQEASEAGRKGGSISRRRPKRRKEQAHG